MEGSSSGTVGNPDGLDCCICRKSPTEPVAAVCGHVFCWPCIFWWLGPNTMPCPECKHALTRDRHFISLRGPGAFTPIVPPSDPEISHGGCLDLVPPRPHSPLLPVTEHVVIDLDRLRSRLEEGIQAHSSIAIRQAQEEMRNESLVWGQRLPSVVETRLQRLLRSRLEEGIQKQSSIAIRRTQAEMRNESLIWGQRLQAVVETRLQMLLTEQLQDVAQRLDLWHQEYKGHVLTIKESL